MQYTLQNRILYQSSPYTCQGMAAGRWHWEAPEGVFPRTRLVECLAVSLG